MMLRIVAAGMVSCMGDLRTGCAAQRAGLSRVMSIGDELGLDGDIDGEPILGSPIRGLTDGFVQTGRWMRLALAALADARRGATRNALPDAEFRRSMPVLWCLPLVTPERFGWSEAQAPELLRRACLECLAELSELPLRTGPDSQFFCSGPAALALSVDAARRLLASDAASSVLVVGTDSWIDPMAITSLIAEQRLKTAHQPVGFRPGEAGVCLLLDAGRGPSAAATPLAGIGSVKIAPRLLKEPTPARRLASAPAIGRALADTVRACLAETPGQPPFHGDVIVDLNGEPWRAVAWGHAQVLLNDIVDWQQANLVIPATSFADVGAASAAVATCLAIRAYARGYARSNQTLVCSLSDAGQASALLVQRP